MICEEEKMKNKLSKLILSYSAKRLKVLFSIIVLIVLFNFISTRVLPSSFFLAYAAEIDTNELVSLSNADRVARGLSPLHIDSRLVEAARAKGEDMLAKDYWAHYGPDGESPWQFILAADFDYVYAGENLAKDFTSAAPIHSAWMGSPSHKANILNTNFTSVGIATVTGEFQGSDTTIVIQMFGTARTLEEQIEVSQELNTILPEYSSPEETKLHVPEITEPTNGDILNDGAFSIRGESEDGEVVEMYDGGAFLGDTQVEDSFFNYSHGELFAEGNHEFNAKAIDQDGLQSEYSPPVIITLDTIAPYIKQDTLHVGHVEYYDSFNNYVVSLKIEDNPIDVRGVYEEDEVRFYEVEGYWQGSIQESPDIFKDLLITAHDPAGNNDSIKVSGDELTIMVNELEDGEVSGVKVRKWFIDNLFQRIFTRSLRGQINVLIVLFMLVILTIEWVVVTRSGLTREKTYSIWSIPVFAIILFVSVLGTGGEIL